MSKPKPKILFVTHDAGRTGAPIGLLAFMRWLRANSDWELGTIIRSPGPLEQDFRELGPAVTLGASFFSRTKLGRRLRRFLPRRLLSEDGKIRKLFARGAYDAVYSSTMTNGAVLESLAPFSVPVLTHVHELEYWIWRSGPENLRQVKARTTSYIAASQAVQAHLVRHHGIPASKISVVYEHIREMPPVPSGAEKASARSLLGIPADALVVGGCGAEHWRKGRDLIPQLLGALNRREVKRPVHFVWVGRAGTAEEEFTLAHDLRVTGVEAQFHTSGEVADPFRLFPAFDVFALLSREDPYPLACLEVAATGVPVVCFADAGGMPEFVSDGCGFVAPYLDIESMAGHIAHLAADAEIAARFGSRARAKVAAESTLPATAPKLQAAMEALIALRH